VEELVAYPTFLYVLEKGAGGYAVVEGAVRVLSHEEHGPFGLELALEGPRVRVRRGGMEEGVADLAKPSLVPSDDVGI
jgi:hypothetical protein